MSADRPLDDREFRRWREEADSALASARHQADGDFYNWACFTAEQAAQLAIKALLHGIGGGPWGHDLVRLLESAGDAGFELGEGVRDVGLRLARHYVPPRYPDTHAGGSPWARYGAADARQAIDDATTILAYVDSCWSTLGA